MATKIHVVCSMPGRHRGGRANPPHAVYDLGDHTPEQLRDLLTDPTIHVVIGEPLTERHIAELESADAAKAEKAAAAEAKKR